MTYETKTGKIHPETSNIMNLRLTANQYLDNQLDFLTAAEQLDNNFPTGHYLIAELGILESIKRQSSKSLNLSTKYLEEIYQNPIAPYDLKFLTEFRLHQLNLIDLIYIQKKAPNFNEMALFQTNNTNLIQRYSSVLKQLDQQNKYHISEQYRQLYGHFNELLLITLINRRYQSTNCFALPTLINDDHGGDLLNKTVETSFDIKIFSTKLDELHKIQLKTSRNNLTSFLNYNPLNIKLVFFKEDLSRQHENNISKNITTELINDQFQPNESTSKILNFRYKKFFQRITY